MIRAGEKLKYHIHGLLPSNKFEKSGKFKSKTRSKILWDHVREIKLEIEYGVQSLRVSYDKVNNSDFGYEIHDRFPCFTVEKNENWRELK